MDQPARGWTEKSSLARTGGQAEGRPGREQAEGKERRHLRGMGCLGAWASRSQRQGVPGLGRAGGQRRRACAGGGVGPSSFEPW